MDPFLHSIAPGSDYWITVEGERYHAREERGVDLPRDRLTIARGRFWRLGSGELWFGLLFEPCRFAQAESDLAPLRDKVLGLVSDLLRAPQYAAEPDALYWSATAPALHPTACGGNDARTAGPLAFRRRDALSQTEGIIDLDTDLSVAVQGCFRLEDDNLFAGEEWAERTLTVARHSFPFEDAGAAPGSRTLMQWRDLWYVQVGGQTSP